MLWNANNGAFMLIKTEAELRRFGLSLVVPDKISNSYNSLLTEIETRFSQTSPRIARKKTAMFGVILDPVLELEQKTYKINGNI